MKCTICKSEITEVEEKVICDSCKKEFHKDCWEINKGCGTPGCKNMPEKSEENAVEEISYYGEKTKKCPACSETIPIYAEVCPYCNENFYNIKPVTQEQYIRTRDSKNSFSNEKIAAIWILAAGIFGCFAPFNLIIGYNWFNKRKKILKEELPLQYILCLIGLSFSAIYILLFVIGILIKSFS